MYRTCLTCWIIVTCFPYWNEQLNWFIFYSVCLSPVSQNYNLAWVSEWKIWALKSHEEWKTRRKMWDMNSINEESRIDFKESPVLWRCCWRLHSLMPKGRLRVGSSLWKSHVRVENYSPLGAVSHPNQHILGHCLSQSWFVFICIDSILFQMTKLVVWSWLMTMPSEQNHLHDVTYHPI